MQTNVKVMDDHLFFFSDILDDIENECAKFGIIKKIVWPKHGQAKDKVSDYYYLSVV